MVAIEHGGEIVDAEDSWIASVASGAGLSATASAEVGDGDGIIDNAAGTDGVGEVDDTEGLSTLGAGGAISKVDKEQADWAIGGSKNGEADKGDVGEDCIDDNGSSTGKLQSSSSRCGEISVDVGGVTRKVEVDFLAFWRR